MLLTVLPTDIVYFRRNLLPLPNKIGGIPSIFRNKHPKEAWGGMKYKGQVFNRSFTSPVVSLADAFPIRGLAGVYPQR